MYFDNMIGTGSYTTSTTNMYPKDRFHVLGKRFFQQRDPNLFHMVTVRKGSTSAQAIALVVGEAGKVVVDNDMLPLAVFVQTNGVRAHRGRLRLNKDVRDQGIHLKINKIEKRLVLILLVLVFKHKTKI